VQQFVDWKKFGIAALYSLELHLMADIGDGPQVSGDNPGVVSNTVMAAGRKTEREQEEEDAHEKAWQFAEKAAAATLRVLTACVKYGSTETISAFLDRMAQQSTQNDVLMIAGYAGVFTRRSQSEASLRFVELWNEVLRALASRSLVDTSMLSLLDTLARLLPRLLMPYADRIAKALDAWKVRCASDGIETANEELLRGQQVEDSRMLASLVQLAGLYFTMLSALSAMRFSKQEHVDGAAKELAMRRLLPPGAAQVTSSAKASNGADHNALVAFLSVLFYDSVLRMAEGWEPSNHGHAANDSLARQDAVSAIKGVLASFCVLDEERRFELFQLSARLEARWMLALPPALMHAITELTEQALYKRALEPYLLRERIMEAEGEFVLDAQWMVQEVPRARAHVLFLITNRALYLLENTRLGGMCQVCESWKLCPSGPRLVRRVALYKVSKLMLDFTTAYGAGHRMKIELTGDLSETVCGVPLDPEAANGQMGCELLACAGRPTNPRDASCNPAALCCARDADKSGKGLFLAAADEADAAAKAPDTSRQARRGGAVLTSELQFSSLYSGVVQRLANAIRSAHPRAPPITLDTYGQRAIQMHRAQGESRDRHGARGANLMEHVAPFHALVALRCELLKDDKPHVRLLIVTETHVELYAERPELFGVPLMRDQETSAFSGRDGQDVLQPKESVAIEALSTLELEMSAEPRARLADGGTPLLLEFADDTGAMLFRHHMRRALFGRGQVSWKNTSLGGERT